MPTYDHPPSLAPAPLVAMARLVTPRPTARTVWHVESKLAHNPSAYSLVVQWGRMAVSALFASERAAFRIFDYERDAWIDAATPEAAAGVVDAILERPPRLMNEAPASVPRAFLDIVSRVRELAPDLVILWDRESATRVDPWGIVLVVETPPAEPLCGQAVCHFSKDRAMWGIGIAAGATQAYWASTPSEAGDAILRYLRPPRPAGSRP